MYLSKRSGEIYTLDRQFEFPGLGFPEVNQHFRVASGLQVCRLLALLVLLLLPDFFCCGKSDTIYLVPFTSLRPSNHEVQGLHSMLLRSEATRQTLVNQGDQTMSSSRMCVIKAYQQVVIKIFRGGTDGAGLMNTFAGNTIKKGVVR